MSTIAARARTSARRQRRRRRGTGDIGRRESMWTMAAPSQSHKGHKGHKGPQKETGSLDFGLDGPPPLRSQPGLEAVGNIDEALEIRLEVKPNELGRELEPERVADRGHEHQAAQILFLA